MFDLNKGFSLTNELKQQSLIVQTEYTMKIFEFLVQTIKSFQYPAKPVIILLLTIA